MNYRLLPQVQFRALILSIWQISYLNVTLKSVSLNDSLHHRKDDVHHLSWRKPPSSTRIPKNTRSLNLYLLFFLRIFFLPSLSRANSMPSTERVTKYTQFICFYLPYHYPNVVHSHKLRYCMRKSRILHLTLFNLTSKSVNLVEETFKFSGRGKKKRGKFGR